MEKQNQCFYDRVCLTIGVLNPTGGNLSDGGINTNQTTRAVKPRRKVPRLVYPAASVNKHGRSVGSLSAYMLLLMEV